MILHKPATVCQPSPFEEEEETFLDWGISYTIARSYIISYIKDRSVIIKRLWNIW